MKFQCYALCLLWLLVYPPRTEAHPRQYFEFYNNFWMNLHHTLFREATVRKMPLDRQKLLGVSPVATDSLSSEEKQIWDKAVQFYTDTFAGRRLLFDEGLVHINNALSLNGDESILQAKADLPATLVDVLRSAAPIYKKHWWPEHEKTNREWIAAMRPKVEEMAPAVVPRLEELMQEKWPAAADRFDVTYYVFEIGGAYTTENPGHTTLAASRPENSGLDGLETVFHEGTHLITYHLEQALDRECQMQKKGCRNLWHAVQFFTVGAVVKAEMAKRGSTDFTPYAYKFGLYEREPFKAFRAGIEKDWSPYVAGKVSFDGAIKNLVADVP